MDSLPRMITFVPACTLGDVIVIELINKFATRVERELAGDLPMAVIRGLREIDNVRPLLMIPVWVDGLLVRACPSMATRVRVKEVWDQMADDFLHLDFVRDRDTWSPFDLVDGMDSGLIVVDQKGRIVYANRAYADLMGADNESEVRSVESVFSRRAEAADIVYKMSNRAREGQVCVEEFRLSDGLHNQNEGAKWFRMRARSLEASGFSKPLLVWQVSDVTDDRIRQETAFQELQNAIHYLDHAPAGFLSSETNGAIVYINATLADWLGIDLTRFTPGKMNLSDLIVGDGVALLETVKADEDGVNTAIIDLDMTKSDGTRLPVRLYHRVPGASDGAPGATRTLVLNRVSTEGGDGNALRDAEIRFTRFFDNTPIAIAALNAAGSIVRTNAPFLRMFGQAVEEYGSVSGMKYKKIADKEDRAKLKSVFKAALSGQSEIDPIDFSINGSKDRFVQIGRAHV